MGVGTFQNPGPATLDEIAVEPLLNELREEIGIQAERIEDERNAYIGEPTLKQTEQVVTIGMEFKPDGQGGGVPGLQHLPSYSISLTAPDRLTLGTGIKQRAWEEGLTSNDVRRNVAEAMKAYQRVWRKCITQAKLALSGWYDATLTPPPFDGITFTGSHTHYVAYNASSTPTQNIMVDNALLISEHGYDPGRIFAEMNQYTLANLVKLGEVVQTNETIYSPLVQDFQRLGMNSQYTLGGVPLTVNNYIANGYMWMGSVERPPMKARREVNDAMGLNTYMETIIPNSDMRWISEFSCWAVVPDVVELGAGVAIWLADAQATGVYTAPASLITLV